MKFLFEGKALLNTIKTSLINAGIDLTSSNGGKCREAAEHIQDNFGYTMYVCSIYPHNELAPISINGHYVNLINNEVIDYTASQYKSYVNSNNIPCPVVAKFNKDKNVYESELFDYYLY